MTGIFKVNLQLEEINSIPSSVSGAIILYADATSHRLYARNASGVYILGSMDNPMTNAGDLIVGGASGVPTRMGVGTANYALTVNSGATGIGYSDGSSIPQVAQNTSDISDLQSSKQDKLTAGTGIDITSNVISATLATTSNPGIVQPDGTTITISDGVISGVPGFENPMTTVGDIIVGGESGSATRMGIGASNYVLGVNSAGTALEYSDGSNIPAIAGKQDTLTAGTGIDITSDTISATIATSSDFGIVKPDNVTVTVTDGVLTSLSSGGMTNPMTTAGDVIVGGTSGDPARLGLGTANQALTVNSDATGIAYSDGSNIPQVAQNTQDIANIEYQINTPTEFYLTSDETSTGSGVYVLSTITPTAVSGTTLSATISSTSAKIFEFSYTFPLSGVINPIDSFTPDLTFSGLDTTKTYNLSFILNHVAQDSTITQVAGASVTFEPTSTTYNCNTALNNVFFNTLSYSAGDKLVLEIYGNIAGSITFTREYLPEGATIALNGVCYGAGKFVTVGYEGKIYTSPDGETWTEQSSGVSGNLFFVYYGNGKFITCDGLNGYFLTSSDGVTWEKVYNSNLSSSSQQYCGCYGAGKYVTCGAEYSFYSSDGENWSRSSLPNSLSTMRGVCYTNSHGFVSVGNYDSCVSEDGISWDGDLYIYPSNAVAVCYGVDKFVAVCGTYGNKIWTSFNGIDWVSHEVGYLYLNSICYGNGKFVAVGNSGHIYTSPDGLTWTVQTSGVSTALTGIAGDGSGNYSIVGSGVVLLGTTASATGISCDLDVEDPNSLSCVHENIPPYILAENVYTRVSGVTQTQQAYNESVNSSLLTKQNRLTAGTGIKISGSTISATTATSSKLGIVRPDNSTITVNGSGIISCSVTSGMTNPMTTQGDIIVGGSSGTPARLGIGTTGQVLTVNSNADGVTYQDLPIATTLSAGIVQPDGTTVTINNGVISSTGSGSVTTFRYWN